MQKKLITLSKIFNSIQQERGAAVLYINECSPQSKKLLLSCFLNTDQNIKMIDNCIQKTQVIKDVAININNNLMKLPQQRENILLAKISNIETIDYYSNYLISPIMQIMINIIINVNNVHPNAISAYCFFLHWKEKTGLERAKLISGFAQHNFNNKKYLANIEFLLNEQNYYKKSFLSLATIEQQRLIYRFNKLPIIKILDDIHFAIKVNKQKSLHKIKAVDWFDIISKKIDAMHTIEQSFINNLLDNHSLFAKTTKSRINIEQRLAHKLTIFSNIDNSTVEKLLKKSKIYRMPKNKNIITKNSIVSHLHVILSGWVKIYQDNIDSKETILKILDNGSSILSNHIFTKQSFIYGAKTISDVLMLSIPINIIDKYLKNNSVFATNLTKNIAVESMFLLQELSIIKNLSADQRVGLFLLGLYKKNKLKSKSIVLPYSKSTIASSLNMSREVFSRIINSLKSRGFIINKNIITIPNKLALCNYCNSHIENKCTERQGDNCINNY